MFEPILSFTSAKLIFISSVVGTMMFKLTSGIMMLRFRKPNLIKG